MVDIYQKNISKVTLIWSLAKNNTFNTLKWYMYPMEIHISVRHYSLRQWQKELIGSIVCRVIKQM